MSDNYYVSLAVVDRVSREALAKFGTYGRFSVACGYQRPWWYKTIMSGCGITVNTLAKASKTLDVSAEYLLTGSHKKPAGNISIEHLPRLKLSRIDHTLMSIKSRIRHGKQHDITITTLLNFADNSGVEAMRILKGEF